MNDRIKRGQYSKGGFGVNQNLVLLASLMAFILAYYFGFINDSAASTRFEALKQSSPFLNEEKITELKRLSVLEDADADFTGKYAYLVDYGSGTMLRGDIAIDEKSISRSISVNHLSMVGSANYEIVGATVQYSNVSGDSYLFSEHGTAIGEHPEYGTYLEIDGDMKLFAETQYTQDDYKPLSKSLNLTLIERVKRLSVWTMLQMLFGAIGVGILLFTFIRILVQNRSGPKNGVLTA